MKFLGRIVRYVGAAIAIAGLIISIKACSTPPTQTPSTSAPSATTANSPKQPININTAILSELDKLEAALGVPALSHKIQASRPYGSPADLVSKNVLSQAQFDQVKNWVTVEEIELTGAAKDIDYMTKLGLMKGHMLVAQELLALNKPDQAEPHLGHPVEEIYVDLEEQLQERTVPEFKADLLAVQDLVKSKPNDPQIAAKFEAAMQKIDGAIAVLPETQRQSPAFVLQVINGLLETASAEYTAAIANGKIKEAIEYQDSRGFVTYAQDTLWQGIAPAIQKTDVAAAQQMTTTFTALRQAWPAPVPPAAPVLSADEVAAKVKQVEMTSAPVLKAAAS